jgi:hypothetical protein
MSIAPVGKSAHERRAVALDELVMTSRGLNHAPDPRRDLRSDARGARVSAALRLSPRAAAVASVAAGFDPATASELERVGLTRRFDRKFLLRVEDAAEVVAAAGRDYRVVLARGERFALYDTIYFDTPSLRFYHDHRRGRRPRAKLRVRNYVDRELSMLELKEKTSRGDTAKLRWERPSMSAELTGLDVERLRKARPGLFSEGALVEQARTVFYRLMLVNVASVERATLDFGLSLERGDERCALDGTVVVEVKDGGRGTQSPLVAALRQRGARALPFSKYCMAVALLGHERANAFRPALRAIEGGL